VDVVKRWKISCREEITKKEVLMYVNEMGGPIYKKAYKKFPQVLLKFVVSLS